jgi:hypothetical protein
MIPKIPPAKPIAEDGTLSRTLTPRRVLGPLTPIPMRKRQRESRRPWEGRRERRRISSTRER